MAVKYKFNRPVVKDWIKAIETMLKSISGANNIYNKAELHIRGAGTDVHENDLVISSYAKIPKGNYYIKYFFMNEPKGLFDLCHNKDFKFETNGRHPIFLFMNEVTEKADDLTVILLTVGQFFRKAIWDRLNQIEYNVINNSSPARWDLLDGTKASVFRYAENNPSNTLDHAIRIANRIVIIPPHRENGNWDFDPHKNPHGSLTDCLDSPLIDSQILKSFCKKIDLILGVGSEGSGIKNTLSEDTPAILEAKMAYPEKSELEIGNPEDRFANDPMSYKDPVTGEIYSIFGKAQKTFARMKSLVFANPNKFINNDKLIEGHGYSYHRNYCYLHKDPNVIGNINHSDVDTTFNILVAFLEGPTEIRWNDGKVVDHKTLWQGEFDKDKNILDDKETEGPIIEQLLQLEEEFGDNPTETIKKEIEELHNKLNSLRSPEMIQRRWDNALSAFEVINKDNLSLYANYADCHIDISNEVAEQLIVLNRSVEIDLLPGAYTEEVQVMRQRLDAGEIIEVRDNALDAVLGYRVTCEVCNNQMVACDENKLVQHFATINQSRWFCQICENDIEVEAQDLESFTFRKWNKFLKGLDIDSMDLSNGIKLNSRAHLPLGIARAINSIGLKGVTFPVSDAVLGNINAQMPHPETGEITNLDLKVDAIVPYGAIKGKNKAISLAEVTFINAIFGTKYSPFLQGNDENFVQKLRDIYSKSKIVWTRKSYNPHTGRIETLSTPIRFGLINLSVTEVNSEFFKVRGENNPGKIYPLSLDYQTILGFGDLPDMIRKSSLESIDNPKQKNKILSLIKAYKGDSK